MYLFYKPGVTYTVTQEFNSPEPTYKRRGMSGEQMVECVRRIIAGRAHDPMRKDWIDIEGSDGSRRTFFP